MPERFGIALSVALAAALGGCLSPAYINQGAGRSLEEPKGDIGAILMDPVAYAVRETFFEEPPRCIAVMPFTSAWDEDAGAAKVGETDVDLVRRAFYAALAPSARLDIELEQVDEVMSRQHRRTGNRFRRASLILGCDSYLVGQVTVYRNMFYGVYSRVEVGAVVKILRTRDGVELWRASHTAESHGGGLILSPFSVVTEIFDASSNARDEQIHRVTGDLARRLVATIPGFDGELSPTLRIARGPEDAPIAGAPQRGRQSVRAQAKVVTVSRLNVRAGPGKDYPVMQQMTRGTRVLAIGEPLAEGWTEVRLDNGRTGYVASPYLGGRKDAATRTTRARTIPKTPPPSAAPVAPVSAGEPAADLPAQQAPEPEKDPDMGAMF